MTTLPAVAARLEALARCRRDGGLLISVTATNDRTGIRFTELLPPCEAMSFARELQSNGGFSAITMEPK